MLKLKSHFLVITYTIVPTNLHSSPKVLCTCAPNEHNIMFPLLGELFVRLLGIQNRVQNLKSPTEVVLKICSLVYQKLYGSCNLGHNHFYGKLFEHLIDIPHTKPCTKFEVSSSLAQVVLKIGWHDLERPINKGQGHSFSYQSISHRTSCRLSIASFALGRTI